MRFAFVLPPGRRADVDNLCDPVWEGLIGKKHGSARWFGGQRTNLDWMAATKSHAATTRCMLTTAPRIPDELVARFSELLLQDTHCGPLPKKVTNDPAHRTFSDWAVARARSTENTPRCPCGFALAAQNLGDISTGPVKAMLDGLAGVLGADEWRDVDDRVVALVTEPLAPDIPPNCVDIRVGVLA